jgi:hypothetical protein
VKEEMYEINWENIETCLSDLQQIKAGIKRENTTRKEFGGVYKIRAGYSTQVRRPVRDILKWMDQQEEIMIFLLHELMELRNSE